MSTMNCNFCNNVGCFELYNNLQDIRYKSNWRKLMRRHSSNSGSFEDEPFEFDVGNGQLVSQIEDAIQAFTKREFPQVADVTRKTHKPILVPETYLYNEMTENALTKHGSWKQFDETTRANLFKFLTNLKGAELENRLFMDLGSLVYSLQLENIVIISSWKEKGSVGMNQKEFDFLIISQKLKSIIHIEAKQSGNKIQISKASEQLEGGFQFFKETLPFAKDENWSFVKVIAFASSYESICSNCLPFTIKITEEFNLEDWWKKLNEKINAETSSSGLQTYQNVVQFLLFHMHLQGQTVTKSDLIEYTQTKAEQSFLCWTRSQKELMGTDYKRVLLASSYGTGKTTLLQMKAKDLLKARKKKKNVVVDSSKIIFVLFSPPNSLLSHSFRKEFRSWNKDVEFHYMAATDSDKLVALASIERSSHFFFDETPVLETKISTQTLSKISGLLDAQSFLWISCLGDKTPDLKDPNLKDFYTPNMMRPLRNSYNVLKIANTIKTNIGGTLWPKDVLDDFLNTGTKIQILCTKSHSPLIHAAEQLSKILQNLNSKTIIKIELEQDEIIETLNCTPLKDRLMTEDDDLDEFLTSQGKILITTMKNESFLSGFEIPVLVLFTSFINGLHNNNVISRCISHLIIIANEAQVNLLPLDETIVEKIEIADSTMPRTFEKACKENRQSLVYNFLHGNRPVTVDIRNDNNATGLIVASGTGASGVVQKFINKGSDLSAADSEGKTALHHASHHGHFEVVKILLDANNRSQNPASTNVPIVDIVDAKGQTALHLACALGHVEIVNALLISGANYLIADAEGRLPIHLAINKDGIKVIEKLLEVCNSEKQKDAQTKIGRTPLHLASIENLLDIVQCLLSSAKCDSSIKDENTNAAIHYATQYGHYQIVAEILRYNKESYFHTNHLCEIPLHLASKLGDVQTVKLLLSHGKDLNDVNIKDLNGETALHQSVKNGHRQTVEILISTQASLFVKNMSQETVLHQAVKEGHLEIISYLISFLSKYCPINKFLTFLNDKDGEEMSALHYASNNKSLDILKLLADTGNKLLCKTESSEPNIEVKNRSGYSAFHLAVLNEQFEAAKLLEQRGADLYSKDKDGNTALHNTVNQGNFSGISFLMDLGFKVDTKNSDGYVALYFACSKQNFEIIDFLVKRGANVNIKNGQVNQDEILNEIPQMHIQDITWALSDENRKIGYTALHQAAKIGHLITVVYLLDQGAKVNDVNGLGYTPLHLASAFGMNSTVDYLTSAGADIDAQDMFGFTPMHLASQNGHLKVVVALVNAKSYLDKKTKEGMTPLHLSASKGHISVVNYLILNKAKINLQNVKGETPLFHAVSNNCVEVAENLLDSNAEVNVSNIDGKTIFHVAIKSNFHNVIEMLARKKVNLSFKDKEGNTPLHVAASVGNRKTVEIVVEGGASLEAKNNEGNTPFLISLKYNNESVASYLLEKKCNPKATNNQKNSAIHFAAKSCSLELTKELISKGLNKNASNQKNLRPIHITASWGRLEILRYLVESGCSVNVTDHMYRSCIHFAAKHQNEQVLEYLVANKADVNAKDKEGKTALHVACESGQLDVVKFLIQDCFSPDKSLQQKIYTGETPLFLAAINGHVSIAEYLLSLNADFSVSNSKGDLLIHNVVKRGHHNVIELLIRWGANLYIKDSNGYNVLHFASISGHIGTVDFLLNNLNLDISERTFSNQNFRQKHEFNSVEDNKSTMNSPLHFAAKNGHQVIVQILINKRAQVQSYNSYFNTPLHCASIRGHVEIADILIRANANINAKNTYGQTPLHVAACNGHRDVVELLISKGAKVNERDTKPRERTALHYASHRGHDVVVQQLIFNNAELNARDSLGRTPLHNAAHQGHLNTVKLLIAMEGNSKAEDIYNYTPLDLAYHEGNNQVVSYLKSIN